MRSKVISFLSVHTLPMFCKSKELRSPLGPTGLKDEYGVCGELSRLSGKSAHYDSMGCRQLLFPKGRLGSGLVGCFTRRQIPLIIFSFTGSF
jgi:hypothetical protein